MTTFVNDTFTGSGNLEAHVGETGASWVLNASFGPGASGELILSGGKLTRPTFGVGGSNATGEALAYASGTVSGDFFIETSVSFANLTDGAAIGFYSAADAGGARVICQLGAGFSPDGTHNLAVFNPGSTHNGVNVTLVAATSYVLRLEVTSGFYTCFIDGVQKVQVARSVSPSNQYGLSIYDGSGTAVIAADYFTVGSLAPTLFWTDFVGTSEL